MDVNHALVEQPVKPVLQDTIGPLQNQLVLVVLIIVKLVLMVILLDVLLVRVITS